MEKAGGARFKSDITLVYYIMLVIFHEGLRGGEEGRIYFWKGSAVFALHLQGAKGLSLGIYPIRSNLIRGPSMGGWFLSRRDRLIVAMHEVPE
jgi:hypothetical protein